MERKIVRNNPNPFPKGISDRDVLNNHLVLEDPPPEAFRRYKESKWFMITKALKLRPSRWYRIQVYDDPRSAGAACTRLKKEFSKQGFEFAHSKGKLWGRYVGTSSQETASSTNSTTTTTTAGSSKQDHRPDERESSASGARG